MILLIIITEKITFMKSYRSGFWYQDETDVSNMNIFRIGDKIPNIFLFVFYSPSNPPSNFQTLIMSCTRPIPRSRSRFRFRSSSIFIIHCQNLKRRTWRDNIIKQATTPQLNFFKLKLKELTYQPRI